MLEKVLKIFGEDIVLDETSRYQGFPIHHLHTLLPYDSYDITSGLFYNHNATGFILRAQPLVGASLEDQGQLAEFFRQKDHLPEGCSLQFLLVGSPRIGPLLDYWAGARVGETYQALAARRREFMAKKAGGVGFPQLLNHYVLISMTFPGCVKDPLGVEAIQNTRSALENALKLIGMPTERLDAKAFLQEMCNLLNFSRPFHHEPSSWNEHIPLSKQIISPEHVFVRKAEGVNVDFSKKLIKTYIPKTHPKEWGLGHMDRLIGEILSRDSQLPCPFWLHYGLTVSSNQAQGKARVAMRREATENAMKNKLTKWMVGLQEQYEEADSCLREINMGERIIQACLSMTLFTEPENIGRCEAKLRHIWNTAGWEAAPNTFLHFEMWLSCLPMSWTMGPEKYVLQGQLKPVQTGWGPDLVKMGRAKETITKEAQNLLPIVGEYKGQLAPGMLLYGRRGQPFLWSPFSTALLPNAKNAQTDHNYNVCIAGQSGSGKSVFMQELMVSTLGIGGKVFVLDFGRSFERTCKLLKGQHIEFDMRHPISLNPFPKIPTGNSDQEAALRHEMLAAIKPILQVMAAPTKGTEDKQNSRLERALKDAWNMHQQSTTIDHLYEALQKDPNPNYRELGDMLYSFTSRGDYGQFFSGSAQATLSADLVVIETDHLRSFPHLMAVLVQMMILEINQTMARGNRQQPFLIIIDEAWKLLTGKDTGAFIGEITRTARKYKGGLVLGTQHLKDYFKEDAPAAREAFDCSAWKCILYQEADTIQALKHHTQLKTFVENEFQESLLTSVKAEPPHYSEIAIYGPNIKGVIGRLSLDPFSRLLYSTNPEEFHAVEAELKKGHSVEDAVERALLKLEENKQKKDLKPAERSS